MTETLAAKGFPVVLAGPSGSGKTTVARALAEDGGRFRFSVSATTRRPREGERDGRDYVFLDREAFLGRRDRGELLEWARVHGEWYGTPRDQLERAREEGVHLLLDIDVQGARSVRRLEPDAVTIFLLPPSGVRVVQRLADRGSEGREERRRRLETATGELDAVAEFDFVIVNDVLERAVAQASAVVTGEELRIRRMGERVSSRAAELEEEIRGALAHGTPAGSGPDGPEARTEEEES
ncbi:MAG TPA: guanylate kinase [Gemmatimonadota bacterium]|nr:guanylate kinase [Gemmatimonadota bacterium]